MPDNTVPPDTAPLTSEGSGAPEKSGARVSIIMGSDSDWPTMRAAAEALVWALRAARTERLSLEKVNGAPLLGTPLAEAMLAAGFYSSPSGIRFRS